MSGGDISSAAGGITEPDALNAHLVQAYVEDARLQGLTPKTIVDYESNLRIFATFLGKEVTAVTRDDLKGFLTYLNGQRKAHPKTIARYFSALSSFYDFLAYEEWVDANPVLPLRKRYVTPLVKKHGKGGSRRQLITVEQARALVHSILDPRDRAINVLLAKTGMRRGELVLIDLEDIDWVEQSIALKPRAKRTNLRVFFDDEAARALKRWIRAREGWPRDDEDAERALFVNQRGGRSPAPLHEVGHVVVRSGTRRMHRLCRGRHGDADLPIDDNLGSLNVGSWPIRDDGSCCGTGCPGSM